jgi:pyruvate kinase
MYNGLRGIIKSSGNALLFKTAKEWDPMDMNLRRTKIVATLGPASNSPEMIRRLILAGMDVARLNFSHGSYNEHARTVANLRGICSELGVPITILQDLQGPKVRIGQLPGGEFRLEPGATLSLVPEDEFQDQPASVPIDYPHAAEEATVGMQVLLDDGLLELRVVEIRNRSLICRVIEGGLLKSRKGVNFPSLNLRMPSLTEKDIQDLKFGLDQDVDWISLSFVRNAADIRALKAMTESLGRRKPVIAKIEKPQAVEQLEAILSETDGVMVARGDLGVEMSPEKVPLLQKLIIEQCNRRGLPVITATQMLESMIQEPRPTRAEASDVANAIIDGTDAVMLSGETAVGAHPVKAVEMMARIAREVESQIEFKSYPPAGRTETQAFSEAATAIARVIDLQSIVVITTSGHTARFVAAERPKPPVIALTCDTNVYHILNLIWGIHPFLVPDMPDSFEALVGMSEATLKQRGLAATGDKLLVLGGIPARQRLGTNFAKIHTVQ